MSFAFYPEEKALMFAIRDFEPATQRLLMSTLDINGLMANPEGFKHVVATHLHELIKDPEELKLAQHIASKGQVVAYLKDETNGLNFKYNTFKITLFDLGREAAISKKLCIDFDHTLSKGHQNDQLEGPFDGAIEALQKLKQEGYKIVIYSCRANSDHGRKQIEEWLKKYDCPYDEIFIGKPEAMAYVDDRSIPFKGNWAEVLKDIGDSHDAELNKSTSVSIQLSVPSSTDNQLSCREGKSSQPLSAKEISSAFLPSLPGVVWETHDGPDMQHSPSTPLEMLHPVNQDNTYDSMTAIHDKKEPSDLLHFMVEENANSSGKNLDQSQDVKEEDESNVEMNKLETSLGKRDIAKLAATNEEHMAVIKQLVDQRQFEKAMAYIEDNKIMAPKLLKGLFERSDKEVILNKDQALVLLQKGSKGAQSNAVKWLAKNNSINELASMLPVVSFDPVVTKEIIEVFKDNKNVIVLNRLFSDKSIPELIRRDILEVLISIMYVPVIDDAIKDSSELIRSTAYKLASRLKAKNHLMEEGTKDPSAKVRREVYTYLWEDQSPEAMDLFYKGQKDTDPSIQGFVKEKVGLSKSRTKEPAPTHGDELTPKIMQEGVEDAEEYYKKHPELLEKLKKEQAEREKTIQYNKSLNPIKNKLEKEIEEREKAKKSSLDKEAIQPPAYTSIISPAFEWGDRDDGLLAKDVKQYYGRPKSEFRNDMNLLPEFLKKMVDDKLMEEPEETEVTVKLGADKLSPGTPFKLKVDVGGAPAGTPGYILWQTDVPTTYYVWIQGIESEPTDIPLPQEYMDLDTSKVTPSVEETPKTEDVNELLDPKNLNLKRTKVHDEILDEMLKHPEGSPERKKLEDDLRAIGVRWLPLSKKAEGNAYDNYEMEEIYNEQETDRVEHDEGVLIMDRDWISDTQTFPRGKPLPPARWDSTEREDGEIGGDKLRNGVTYWEPSPGNLDGMPAGQNFSSLTVVVEDGGTKTTCTWDEEDDALGLDEATAVAALTAFIQSNMPHLGAKFKSISVESVDLSARNIVLRLDGAIPEPNEKK